MSNLPEYDVLMSRIASFYRILKKDSKFGKTDLDEEYKNNLLKLFEETFNSFKIYELEIDEHMNKLSYTLGNREYGRKYKDKFLQVKIDYNSLLNSDDIVFIVTDSNKITNKMVGLVSNKKTINISEFIPATTYGRDARWVITLLFCKSDTKYFYQCCDEYLDNIFKSGNAKTYSDFEIFLHLFTFQTPII